MIEGKGIPVFIPGSAVYYPRIFSEEIKRHLQLVHVDHRGFVPSPSKEVDNSAYDLDILVEDIETMRKHLDLDNFIIMGHSGHAFMALEYAKKYPEHVSGVVMIGVTPDYSGATHKAADLFFERTASEERKAAFEKNMGKLPAMIARSPEQRFVSYCLAAGPKSWFDHSYDAAPLWEDIYTNMQMLDHVWGVVFRDIDITKGLQKLNKPVFLVLGRFDFLTGPPELWDDVKKYFKNITIKIFEKSSHCPMFEEAELFSHEILHWIKEMKITG